MAKPTSRIDWTESNTNQATVSVEPSAGKKLAGWGTGERPPAQTMNWLFQNIDEWLKYLEGEVDAAIAARTEYDAVVGVGGTHATLAALMSDTETQNGNNKNILVSDPQVFNAPVTLDVDDMNFVFKPQANIFKGTGTNRALVLDAERIRIMNARFANFSTSGDIPVELTSNSKYCIISQCYFLNNDGTIQDDGVANVLANNIEEV